MFKVVRVAVEGKQVEGKSNFFWWIRKKVLTLQSKSR